MDRGKRMIEMNPMLKAAIDFHLAGYSVIPAKTDGTKAPIGAWKKWCDEQPSLEQVIVWFKDGHEGIGLVTGFNNLECLEVEGRAVASKLHVTAKEIAEASGLGELWQKINSGYVEQSPSGGIHWLYRISDFVGEIPGNTKIASRPGENGGIEVLVETRGHHGFIITSPSHGSTHPSGKSWEMIAGSPSSIPVITMAEREALHDIFYALDEMPEKETIAHSLTTKSDNLEKPGDDYNAKADWRDILVGWKIVYSAGGVTYWRRPGKTEGISATTGRNDGDNLYVFTTSTSFDQQKPYSKFAAYAHLHHNDDFSAAARELRHQGFGSSSLPSNLNPLFPLATPLAPLMQIAPIDKAELDESSWKPVDLAPFFDGTYVKPKATLFLRSDDKGLLYPGRVHSFYGESESGKSWLAQIVVAQQLKMFRKVIYIDFESEAADLVTRLQLLKVTQAEILQNFIYIKPSAARDHSDPYWLEIIKPKAAELVIIDGVTEALTMWGGETKDNDAITRWMRLFPRAIAEGSGACVVQIDHVTKDKESRGRFAIGGQAKLATIDGAAFLIEPLEVMAPGRTGTLTVRVTKDRLGSIREIAGIYRKSDRTQEAAVVTIDSTRSTHMEIVIAPPMMEEEAQALRSDKLDSSIVNFIHKNPGATKSKVIRGVEGDDKTLLARIDELIQGQILENRGNARGYLIHVSDNGKSKFNLVEAMILQIGEAN